MTMTEVVDLCRSLSLRPSAGPHGVAFAWNGWRYRVERGSGIAGRGDAWGVVDLPAGPAHPKVAAREKLRRQLLEVMAEGPRPDDRAGFQVYARWHHPGGLSGASSAVVHALCPGRSSHLVQATPPHITIALIFRLIDDRSAS